MTIYVFDTNSLRNLRHYYPTSFATFWERFEGAVGNGGIISVREVRRELESQVTQQWLLDWFRSHAEIFRTPTAADTQFIAGIFAVPHFQMLVGEAQRLMGRPVADPLVIACAASNNGTVVSEETYRPNAARIPNVCEYFNVPCITFEGFLAENDWHF